MTGVLRWTQNFKKNFLTMKTTKTTKITKITKNCYSKTNAFKSKEQYLKYIA